MGLCAKPSERAEPKGSTYAGLFLTTLSLLQLELFLTRIFSVTMWYHFAFMAISLAMFGLTTGAVIVKILPKHPVAESLTQTALLFALTGAICFVVQLHINMDPDREMLRTAAAFIVISIPFVFAGMVICIALTRFPAHTGSLYAADLAGSAIGCVLTIPILNHIHAPTAVILNAAIAAVAAAAFAVWVKGRIRWVAAASCAALVVIAVVNQSAKFI